LHFHFLSQLFNLHPLLRILLHVIFHHSRDAHSSILRVLLHPFLQLYLQDDRVKVVRLKHDQVEEGDAEGNATRVQTIDDVFVVVAHTCAVVIKEHQMDDRLREVLKQEVVVLDEAAQDALLPINSVVVVDAEGVEHAGQHHVFADQAQLSSGFDLR